MGRTGSKIPPSDPVRDAEALRLHHEQDMTLEEIVALGMGWKTKGGVSRAIARAYSRGPGAKVEEIRQRLTSVLMAQLESLVAQFVVADAAGDRDDMAKFAREIVRTSDAISRRNGTDAPVRIDARITDDYDDRIRQLVESMGPAPVRTADGPISA